MKSLIDYKQVREIIEKHRKEHVDNFTDYRYRYNNMSIDDAITEAKAAKELEQITDELDAMSPCIADQKPVYDAVAKLGGILSLKPDETLGDQIKIVADYLGIDISKKESAEDEE